MNSRKVLALPVAFLGGVLLPAFSGCVEKDPDHCLNNGGDAYCGEGKYCTNNCGGDYDAQGCLEADEPPTDGCWACNGSGDNSNCADVGDGDTTETETTAETTADTESTDATETADTETTETGPECMSSGECMAVEEPLCDGGSCVGCGDAGSATCAVDHPDTPVCDSASGACVECTAEDVSACPVEEPACEAGVCVPCDEHEQCPDSACNMSTGECMDPMRVWWVDQSSPGGDGSEANPFQTLADALSQIAPGEQGVIMLLTPDTHDEGATFDGGRTVALIGEGQIITSSDPATVSVSQNATLFLSKLTVAEGDVGVMCSTCDLWIHRGQLSKNTNGEMQILGGNVRIRNSFIGAAGLVNAAAVTVSSGTLELLYSTVAGGGFNSPAIGCINGMNVSVRNSLVVALQPGDEIMCPGITIADSALEADVAGNTALGSMPDTSWFEDYIGGDFSVMPSAPMEISTAAVWQPGDPRTDIDGDPRPASEGATDYAGADVPN